MRPKPPPLGGEPPLGAKCGKLFWVLQVKCVVLTGWRAFKIPLLWRVLHTLRPFALHSNTEKDPQYKREFYHTPPCRQDFQSSLWPPN